MSSHYAYISLDVASHDLAFLENQGVVDFVHFTTADNLPGILREGLLPRKELDSRGIAYTNTDELRLEGKSVVNLSITNPNIKMFYGKRKDLSERLFVVLTLDPALLKDVEGAYEFRSTNAASRFSQPCSIEEVFAGDRPSFFEPNWPTDNQAEVLVRGGISPAHIKTIQFPYSDMGNPEAIAAAASTADLAKELGLSCDILFCNKHFDYNKSFLGELDPKGRYEYYFVSWAEDEQAAAASEEAIRLIERQKTFDSVALMADRLESIEVHPNKEVEPLFTWSMRYHAPAETSERSNAQLSAFAVIEKIVNRGRITRLSYELEQKLSSDDETACAHQAQCAIVELVKHQALKPGGMVRCENGGRLGEILEVALEDIKELSANVCKLYGCDDFLAGVGYSKNPTESAVIVKWADDSSDINRDEARISFFARAAGAIPFDFTRVVEPAAINPDYNALLFLLNYLFRFDGFRDGQLEAIRRGLRRQDTIVLLPTGSGKSVVFQLLSLITPGISFVVCPIISLIEDQITNLRNRGIDRVMGLSSAMDAGSRSSVLSGITTGQHLICYVAPERFQNRSFNASVQRYASTNLISTIAVDEAHCVSEWGHDFRTAYLGLARTCREVCSTGSATPPLLALTGTASTSVLVDMMNDLEISDEYAIIQPKSFDRPEIHYRVIRVPSSSKMQALGQIIDEFIPRDFKTSPDTFYVAMGDKSNCGIVFCPHANGEYGIMASSNQLAAGHPGVWDFMDGRLPGLCSYYAGKAPKRLAMSGTKWNEEKRAQASMFKGNATTVMVATNAFGMGIDKPNVRWVVHYGMPGSLESYYQEVGRAARDQNIAYAYLLLSDDFHELNEELLDPSRTPITEMERRDSAKGQWNDDDVSRVAYFHSKTFAGVENELQTANWVLGACGRENYRDGQWHVQFLKDEKETLERAIYRFRLLGVFDGYAIDYDGRGGGAFVINPSGFRGEALRSHIIESYMGYIRAYQSDEAYVDAARRNVLDAVQGAVNDRDFIMRTMRHLLSSFVYKVLEEGRRRATKTMLDAACRAADAGSDDATDRELRKQMLAYLSTEGRKGKKRGIRSLLNDATNVKLIFEILGGGNRSDLLGQTSRLLEDYPEHYGLHFIQAAIYALDGDVKQFGPSIRSMTSFGTRNYGLSKGQCADNFSAFLNDPMAGEIPAGTIEKLLAPMAEAFSCDEDEVLDQINSPQATMLKEVNALYKIATDAMEGLKWMQAK